MMDFATLARIYGYPAIVLGTMIQGEALLLVAGFLAHQGYLSLEGVWVVAALAASTGDITYFALGRKVGKRLVDRFSERVQRTVKRAGRLVDRNPRKVLIYMRFIFGMRVILPIMCGMSSIRFQRFLRFNLITSFVWAGLFILPGYLFGAAATRLLGEWKGLELAVLGVLAIVAGIYYFYSHRQSEQLCEDELAGDPAESDE